MKEHGGKYAGTIKIGEKGQFVIPKEIRELFDIKSGDTLLILADKKKGIAIPPKNLMKKIASEIFEEGE